MNLFELTQKDLNTYEIQSIISQGKTQYGGGYKYCDNDYISSNSERKSVPLIAYFSNCVIGTVRTTTNNDNCYIVKGYEKCVFVNCAFVVNFDDVFFDRCTFINCVQIQSGKIIKNNVLDYNKTVGTRYIIENIKDIADYLF